MWKTFFVRFKRSICRSIMMVTPVQYHLTSLVIHLNSECPAIQSVFFYEQLINEFYYFCYVVLLRCLQWFVLLGCSYDLCWWDFFANKSCSHLIGQVREFRHNPHQIAQSQLMCPGSARWYKPHFYFGNIGVLVGVDFSLSFRHAANDILNGLIFGVLLFIETDKLMTLPYLQSNLTHRTETSPNAFASKLWVGQTTDIVLHYGIRILIRLARRLKKLSC